MEGTRPPVFLTILPVINKPSDTRFTICAIRTGNLRGAFSVAQNGEGNCELRTQMQLDREAIPNYLLNITVENGGQQDWTLANISVLDVNDNKPKFAEDGDETGNGNSLINYSIDTEETTQGEVGNLFGIDPQSGELWPKKGADELAQISKKNFFRITLIACDNPGEQKRRLCSRAPVSISILDDRHRFVLIFSGESAEQIKHQEKEILNSLRPFTFPCSNPIIERIEVEEGEEDIKKYLKRSKERNEYLVNVILYTANLKEKKLFLIGIAVAVTLVALVGLIALCVFRYKHRRMRRHRAEQIRRRHQQHQQQAYRIGGVGGGFHSAAGLLAAVNGAKASSNYSTHFDNGGALNSSGGIFNTSGHSCLFGSNNNFYIPSNSSGTLLRASHFERGSKLYESQASY
uniref:Cadherin domain-containing protein n=1 Tax=Meloidogyne javanica TaxID=6303 RepID=A0A915MYV0_MELJA